MSYKFISIDSRPNNYATPALLAPETTMTLLAICDPNFRPSIRPVRVSLVSSVNITFMSVFMYFLSHYNRNTMCRGVRRGRFLGVRFFATPLSNRHRVYFETSGSFACSKIVLDVLSGFLNSCLLILRRSRSVTLFRTPASARVFGGIFDK